jgi:hypothetical protein
MSDIIVDFKEEARRDGAARRRPKAALDVTNRAV